MGFANVHFFHPPVLNTEDNFIDIQPNTTLRITCTGKYPLSWTISNPKNGVNDSRLVITSSVNISHPVNKHKSTLTLEDIDFNDTGYYTCFYNGTTDFSLLDNVTSLYVFVNDPFHLFVEYSSIISGHLIIPVQQHRKGVVPCLPTSSRVNVTLWKTENEIEYTPVTLGTDVTFDPTCGFQLHYPTFYFSGSFQCRANFNGIYEEINVTLLYYPDTFLDPKPFIDVSEAKHPVMNGTFTLKCIVNADPGTRLFIDWTYPNKNETGFRINETEALIEWKTTRNYVHQEVVKKLVVKDAKASDSGEYICSVTDHSRKTGRAEVNIFVYASQQPVHVNFTTDISITEPVVYQAGQDVRLVITVHAFPSINDVELYWEKNGELLVSDGHYHMKTMTTTVVLEINQLHRTDAATYTLYGKTKDGINSIAILLEVKDKPIVHLKNMETIYVKDKEYIMECHADGYPSPVVWWRWKPCKQIHNCNEGSLSYGWTEVDYNGTSQNKENVTLEYSDVRTISLVSYLHVTARQSGHYMCVASNNMGKDDVIVPFIVTDAAEGFEISISERKPIDGDYIELACKANAFNFTHVEWKWRPMYFNGDLLSTYNLTNVSLHSNSTEYSLSETIVFNPIHKNMSGEYECIASSETSNITQTTHITIDVREIKKPVLNKTNLRGTSVSADPGTLQEFFCFTDGVPFPDVIWKKDGKIFDVSNMSGVELTERDQKLTIRRVLDRDSGFYECIVKNRGGQIIANATLDILADNKDDPDSILTVGEIVAVAVFGFVGAALVVVVSCLVQRILKEKKQKKELDFMNHTTFERGYIDIFNPNLPLEDQIELLPYKNKWEFPKERLKLGKTLGQGAFGRVVKAEAIGLVDGEASTTVAVKMVKEASDAEQRKALMAELKILIHIGKHLNILNLLGAVTKNLVKGELYVIVEYCCYGNLRHFLLKHKGTFIDQLDPRTGQLDTQVSTLPGNPFSNMENSMVFYSNILGIGVDNPMYKCQPLNYADIAHDQLTDSGTGVSVSTNPASSNVSERYLKNSNPVSPGCGNECCIEESLRSPFITTCDLLCFAFQCARGMEYLASKKLIHRDLAARNVLLAKDNVVKICDFGLAKDCYKYSNYVKKTTGPLPIKWMAIESITDRVFTSKSDVWSFGILLWEIFTLGSDPYTGVEINEEFYKKLKRGYRMEKPDLAPDKIYKLMQNCWLDDPNRRPEFSDLAENIGSLLESGVKKYYVELNTPYQVMNEELLNNNDYLQMTGQNEEYTNMSESDPSPNSSGINHQNTYDNIASTKPAANGLVPRLPMETVPMIQLDSSVSEQWDETNPKREYENELPLDEFGDSDTTYVTYLNMGSSPEKYDLDEYDSVFLEQKMPNKVSHINGDPSSLPLLSKNNIRWEKHDMVVVA